MARPFSWMPDNRRLVLTDSQHLFVWDLATDQQRQLYQTNSLPMRDVRFSADGKTVLASHTPGVEVFDAASGKQLATVRAHYGRLGAAGHGLHEHAAAGRLRIRTHPFWCSPLSFHEMPGDLRADLDPARVVVGKGDLNYRRLVGDCLWEPTTAFADTVAYLRGLTVAALRTLKSDVVVGVPGERVEQLDAEEPDWRINGRQTVVQLSG